MEVTWSPRIMLRWHSRMSTSIIRLLQALGQSWPTVRQARIQFWGVCVSLCAYGLLGKWSFFVTLRQTGIFRHSQVVPTELLMFNFLPDLRLNFWINWCLLGLVKHIKLGMHLLRCRPPQQDPRRSYQPFTLNIVKTLIYDWSKSNSIAYRRREGLPVNHH